MLDAIRGEFDAFHLRTRVRPATLALAPVAVSVMLISPRSPLVLASQILISVGGIALAAQLVREAGKRLELRLAARWGGLPTQRALKLSESTDPELTARRRELVAKLLGRELPSRQMERANPQRADRAYDSAVRELIPLVRGTGVNRLLHQANVDYNFRRNLLACRPIGLPLAACVVVTDALLSAVGKARVASFWSALISLTLAGTWWVVRESFVRTAADTYTSRFYEALAGIERRRRRS